MRSEEKQMNKEQGTINSEQRTMNNEQRKTSFLGVIFPFLIATFSFLICLSCQNPFEPPKTEEPVKSGAAGTGYFSLRLEDPSAGRTIMPEVTRRERDDFAAYTLEFVDIIPLVDGLSADTAFTLSADQWADGNLPTNTSAGWYKFTVTSGITYRVWWNERGSNGGDGTKTADVVVRAKYGNNTYIFGTATSNTTIDSGWSSAQSFTASQTGFVYLEVRPFNLSNTGTYGIVFSTGTTRPSTNNSITPTPIIPNETVTVDRTNENLCDPIELKVGTWDLTVTAYTDAERTKLAAWGVLKGIEINDGATTPPRTIELGPVDNGIGEGTFSWNIGYPDEVEEAYMVITRLPLTSETEPRKVSIFGTDKTGSETLSSGYYRVEFKLKINDDLIHQSRETLHIYTNMDSYYENTFEDRWFNSDSIFAENVEDFGPEALVNGIFHVANLAEWETAKSSVSTGGNNKNYIIYFTNNITVTGSTTATFGTAATGIKVSLRGKGITLTLSGNGNILRTAIYQTVILRDLTLRGGSNTTSVVYVAGGNFTMHSGEISGNTSTTNGSGVYLTNNQTNNSAFTMHGGEITDNKTSVQLSGGGGAYVSSYATFTMHNGNISRNETTDTSGGAGVYVSSNATFSMHNGIISLNKTARSSGGGVYVANNATFTMHNGEISGNIATPAASESGGGGVYMTGANSAFTMWDGKISNNDATGSVAAGGGGVYMNAGTFTMRGGEISGNKATGTSSNASKGGGGVYIGEGGTFTMRGGEISGNTATSSYARLGGGVYVARKGTFRMVAGTIYGSNEADENLRNTASRWAALYQETSDAYRDSPAEFGTFAGETWTLNGYLLYQTDDTIQAENGMPNGIFKPENNHVYNVADTDQWNSAVKSISTYGRNMSLTVNVQSDFSVAGWSNDMGTFGAPSGVTVTLQGAGRTLSLTGNGSIINVSIGKNIILKDLTLQGGSNNASLVNMINGTFTMQGGKISGNKSTSSGAGVYINDGTFTMSGGEISDNTASSGGGVYMWRGIFTMSGGEISDNTASSGGGVYMTSYNDSNIGNFNMNGGKISDNKATTTAFAGGGGGVYMNAGNFTMRGGVISGNTAAVNGGGVRMVQSDRIFPTFRIVTGTIYGSNEVDESLRNTDSGNYGVLYLGTVTFQFGTFSDDTWTANGNMYTTNDTIQVVNGVLVNSNIPPIPENNVFNVANTDEWNGAMRSIATYGNGKGLTVNVTDNIDVAANTGYTFLDASGVTVTLQGADKIMTLTGNGYMLRIKSGQTVVLQDLTLRGHSSNTGSLVLVSAGNFTMNGGEISGNRASNGGGVYVTSGTFAMNSGEISGNTATASGGGVYVTSGTFTMNGGKISDNTAASGGGMYIASDGTFAMQGGVISGNTATTSGGGVYVTSLNTAIFRIVTGTIYGLDAEEGVRNTAPNTTSGGAALFKGTSGVAQRGTFSGTNGAWVSAGNLISSGTVYADTIRVSNGILLTDEIQIDNNHVFDVADTDDWNKAVRTISAFGKDMDLTINVQADFNVTAATAVTFGGVTGFTVTIKSEDTVRTLTLTGNGNMLRIGSGQTVVLEDVTLRGHGSNNNSVVYVNGGTFTMNDGGITGNTASANGGGGVNVTGTGGAFTMNGGKIFGNVSTSTSYSGGVHIASGTSFTMNDGEISGNTAPNGGGVYTIGTFTMQGGVIFGNTATTSGGGVYVNTGGTFVMMGGEVSGNKATTSGGGVYVFSNATAIFRIVTGTIYGLDAEEGVRNTAPNTTSGGAALFKGANGVAQRGTFSGTNGAWVSAANLISSGTAYNNTISVVNGGVL
jgi:hypothetical protein